MNIYPTIAGVGSYWPPKHTLIDHAHWHNCSQSCRNWCRSLQRLWQIQTLYIHSSP